ncbi:hypothetical protein E6O75_ATG08484 [Venturia nashicola]|uniref:Peptidase S59 domain-containing protein n=1 Tax=Venturia nashicola TaxID=86259 RepID=A0A4Z1NKI2_9PEZI|nr:hypothetical protein E6O75_ATG08484 [Venturia nashicola]
MSGFGGFGSTGFGNTTNNNTGTGFGGFGSTSGTSGGFGSSNTGFGATTGGGGLFGSGGFGSNSATSAFGQPKAGFGATATTSSGSLFGGNTTATAGTGFGGFGSSNTTPAFGSTAATTSSGLFGQAKPAAFGSTNTGGLFGSGGAASGGFGAPAASTGFGASATPAFGSGANAANEGTGKVPFTEFTEKDPSATNTTNRYQTITTIDPYKPWSLEELRLVDYTQGRKHGNNNGQAGAFGTSSGFGGFGTGAAPASSGFGSTAATTGSSLFGGNNASTGFGAAAAPATGFGSSTQGGLFGAKPATTGGLFGSAATTTTPAAGGGLFGSGNTNTTTGGAFGGFGNSGTTSGGIFGSTQAKPATGFGGFGTPAATSAGTGFGGTGFGATATPAASGGLFGGTGTSGTGFGATSAQPASTGFGFGQTNQQAQQPATTGGGLFGGGGVFGQNNQQKSGGLFGSTTPAAGTGGLFGQSAQTQQNTGSGLFGGTQQPASGGLFGAKPATGGLFGATASTGGGLFGGNQTAQPAQSSGGLFGNSQQQTSGLFGGSKPANGLGSSLFGNTQTQQQQPASGLFGSSQQQQPMGSLFGSSQQQQQPQQPQGLTANLLQNPYGNDALFANIPTTQNVGPIATPLSTSQKNKKPAMIPSYRLNPSASSRLLTPQKRPAGYGFSYSTYGTPGSAISSPSPLGSGSSLLSASSYGRGLNKSMSTSNLRSSFSAEDSILAPGAFANIGSRNGTGSLKKLNINKNMNVRRSLFALAEPASESRESRKSVSFEASGSSSALVRTESPPAESVTSPNGLGALPVMSQVNGAGRGKELTIVPENGSPAGPPAVEALLSQKDKEAGDYWMKPTLEQIVRMSREEKTTVKDFTVGRNGCGKIVFSKVNLNEVPVQDILGKVVKIQIRQATVYGDETIAKKPPRGQGLNVPSVITLANSWPRAAAGILPVHEKKGLRYEKHIKRLQRVTDTTFVGYEAQTGEWTFSVEHFTTYGFPEEDDDDSMMDDSILDDIPNEAPGTPTPSNFTSKTNLSHVSPPFTSDSSLPSPPESSPDDTFDFKKGPRKHLPGQFSDQDLGDVNMREEDEDDDDDNTDTAQSFLEERSVGSLEDGDMSQASELDTVEDQDMAGSFPQPGHTTEQSAASHNMNGETLKPKSILKASQTVNIGTPLKTGPLLFGADWAEQLQRTVSPKKQDRAALRANQPTVSAMMKLEPTRKVAINEKPFTTSIDLINELFKSQSGRKSVPAKFGDSSRDFEHLPPKRAKLRSAQETSANDEAFHNSTKPNWGPYGTLVYTAQPVAPPMREGTFKNVGQSIVGEHNDVRFGRFSAEANLIPDTIKEQRLSWSEVFNHPVVFVKDSGAFKFQIFADKVVLGSESGIEEQRAWELANILFDDPQPGGATKEFEILLRKQNLSTFWKKLVLAETLAEVSRARSAEEKAILYLSGGMTEEACMVLSDGGNLHLATLVAQIGGNKKFRAANAAQLESWRQLNVLPEIDHHIRAIWELLAGNTNICQGQAVAGIENKAASFSFSSHFRLDWRRSFGLRLWYGIEAASDASAAIEMYRDDLESETETVRPVPWFVRSGRGEGLNDPESHRREDVLWSMLRLYCDDDSVTLDTAFAPTNISGNPMDARLSLQLVLLFGARKIGATASGTAAIDDLASTYASSLSASIASTPDALSYACWALLHLSEPQARIQSIRALLDQHAALLVPEEQVWADLSHDLRIPVEWMHLSRALYAHAIKHDPVMEADCLIKADKWLQAHDVICRVVGPRAVIEGDADSLRGLLGVLREKSTTYQAAWDKGARVYFDYVELKDLERVKGQDWKKLVRSVATALKGIMSQGLQGKDLTERAALQIMGKTIANIANSGEVLEKNQGLRLPLTEDAYLTQSREMSRNYFRALLAGH